jgi:transposase-like protein
MDIYFESYNSLFMHILDEPKAIAFALKVKLIKITDRQCECGALLSVENDKSQRVGLRFRCSKSRTVCSKSYSILHGTWFAGSNLPIRDQILLIYCYALDAHQGQLGGILGLGSGHTEGDWFNYAKDISALYLSEMSHEKIGGVGCTVEIDETCIYKNKNHCGRLTSEQERKQWLFGGICRETKETFFVMVPDRKEETLMEILKKNVLQDTKICSDGWASYQHIEAHGFQHSWVNHSENFVSPEDKSVHTQTIERAWRGVKENIPNGTNYNARMRHVMDYGFKRRTNWYHLSYRERFHLLVTLITRFY